MYRCHGIRLISAHRAFRLSQRNHSSSLSGTALMHLLTASMKGMVALTGLEAMSNGIQFVIDEDLHL